MSTELLERRTTGSAGDRPSDDPASARSRRAAVAAWFWTGAALTFLILVVGGITRLTQSGLSMVEWEPIFGVLPPIGEEQWQEAFDQYRAFPEYQQLRRGMTLEEFQFIYFWEYFHRMLARLLGIVFLLPLVFFLVRGYLDRPLRRRAFFLFGLGAMQALAGWLMVASGLVDRPHVSHYRLAIHLSIAFTIFAFCVWFALDLSRAPPARLPVRETRHLRVALIVIGALLGAQIFWGALVAGLRAGYIFNTFPLMAGSLVPPGAFRLEPALVNLVENPGTTQWMHRVIGTLLLVGVSTLYLRARRVLASDRRAQWLNAALAMLVAAQFALGVATLLLRVPVSLGVAHQGMAMVLAGVWLGLFHRVTRASPRAVPEPVKVTPGSPNAPGKIG